LRRAARRRRRVLERSSDAVEAKEEEEVVVSIGERLSLFYTDAGDKVATWWRGVAVPTKTEPQVFHDADQSRIPPLLAPSASSLVTQAANVFGAGSG
jgi:hypothetical protein